VTSSLCKLRCFWRPQPPADQTAGRLGFILQTVTSFHRPRLIHYYGFIRHLAVLRSPLELPLEGPYCLSWTRFRCELSDIASVRFPGSVPQHPHHVSLGKHSKASLSTARAPCKRPHPQPQCKFGQVLGFVIHWALTHLHCRIRFTFVSAAYFLSLPSDLAYLPPAPLRVELSSP